MGGKLTETRLAVDAMGADLGTGEIVAGVALALKAEGNEALRVTLVGQPDVIKPALAEHQIAGDARVAIHPASEVIGMDEKPVHALKRKRDASMVKAIDLVKNGEARAVISCGNTGALMAGGTLRLRTLDGIERPAIGSIMPAMSGFSMLIDAGANPESRPEHLMHNAVLGSNYAKLVLSIAKPRVGLLTIGTEEGKGTERISRTHALLKQIDGLIHYKGLIEGFQMFGDEVDVIVCDGFTGNVVLKSLEGLLKYTSLILKEELSATPLRKAGAFLAQGAFKSMKQRISPEAFGGAPLLGLRGNVLKAHGSSNRHAIASALRIARELSQHNLIDQIRQDIEEANNRTRPAPSPEPAIQSS